MTTKSWLKMPSILLFEAEYSPEFFSKNPPFLPYTSDTKIQTATIWWYLEQKSPKFENVRLYKSIF